MIHCNRLFASFLIFATALAALAQTNGSNSPYSRYGFGLLSDRANGFNKGMGGVAYGFQKGNELNSKNPASYAALDSLTFLMDAGISLQNGNFKGSNQSVNAKNTSFDYIQAGFRLTKGLGMVVGMSPYSTVGYSVSQTGQETHDDINGYDTQTLTYKGDGGVHEAFLGLGWSPAKNFSIGANAGYLWGELSHLAYETHSNSAFNTKRTEYAARIRSYKLDFGAQYAFHTEKSGSWTIGLAYGLGHDIHSDAYRYRQTLSSGSVSSGDTLTAKDAFQLPHTFGAGLSWNYHDKWRVGIDYTFEKWSSVKYPYSAGDAWESTKGKMLDKHGISAGLEFIPKPQGIRWADRLRYRAGISYSTPYTRVEKGANWTDGPSNLCVSLGMGLPIATKWGQTGHYPTVNIAAQYERVKPKASGMITENYFRLCLGITFNERWFWKWKVR